MGLNLSNLKRKIIYCISLIKRAKSKTYILELALLINFNKVNNLQCYSASVNRLLFVLSLINLRFSLSNTDTNKNVDKHTSHSIKITCGKIRTAGTSCHKKRAIIPIKVVRNAEFFLHNLGKNIVNKKVTVKAVDRLKPIDIAFKMLPMDKASTKVIAPSKQTHNLFIARNFLSSTLGLINCLYTSCVNKVVDPKSRLQAADTSAAQSAAKVIPAITGFNDNIILGKANVAGTPGKAVLAAIPIRAHKKPIGIISNPAIINPFLAVFPFFEAKVICTGPCIDIA